MSLASSMAFAVAERVERTGGPRAGLVAWKAMAGSSTDDDVRGRALLAALRCAVTLREVDALRELFARWGTVGSGVWDEPIAALCNDLARARLVAVAAELAQAEARRHRTARALYLHARCLELGPSSPTEAVAEAFRDAAARAGNEGARDIEHAARVRRIAILSRSWATMSEALEEAGRVDLALAPASSRLVVARVLLVSPSRFVRAGALAVLDDVVAGAEEDALVASEASGGANKDALAMRALALVANWVDDAGDALTPLELDRLVALFGRPRATKLAPRGKAIIEIIHRLRKAESDPALDLALASAAAFEPTPVGAAALAASHARTRDIVRGRFEAPNEAGVPPDEHALRRAFRHGQILDVVVALRDGALARAARSLEALAEADERGERLPRGLFGVAQMALDHDDPGLRTAALRVIERRLARPPTAGAPPGRLLSLADTLAALDRPELAMVARWAAAVSREPGATASLGALLARSGWELASLPDREARAAAIDKLREAKALLSAGR